MKDLNWEQKNYKLQFGPEKSVILMEQLRSDVEVGYTVYVYMVRWTWTKHLLSQNCTAADQAQHHGLQSSRWYT